MRCPRCGVANPDDKSFCGDCGMQLPSPSALGEKLNLAAERRQLTVMFCDLVDSTALSIQLDPEDLRTIIMIYRDRCSEITARYGGLISRYLGDGILTYFGYPDTQENDTERAIRAALDIIRMMPELNSFGRVLQARIGIATGTMVIGDVVGERVKEEDSVFGETPNLAARLQTLAEPNSVVISNVSKRLAGDLFELADLGEQHLKGFSEPKRAWRVVRPKAIETRFEAQQAAGSLVGREAETAWLMAAWASVQSGNGTVALIRGDAGMGKSRLLQEIKGRIGATEHLRLTVQGWAHHQNSAYYPIIEMIQHLFGCDQNDPVDMRASKLAGALERAGLAPAEWMPLLAPLLGLSVPDQYPKLELSPEGKKERTLQGLVTVLLTVAGSRPMLFLVEDAHWLDPSTLEFLHRWVGSISAHRILVLVSARMEFTPPWPQQSAPVKIGPLGDADVRLLATNRAGGKGLPDEVLTQIGERADGIPLFVEELTQLLLDSGALIDAGDHFIAQEGWRTRVMIPGRLQDLLLARLSRLTWEKQIAHLAAVLGRRFAFRLLEAIWAKDRRSLQDGLKRLVEIGVLLEEGPASNRLYTFRHALIQEAAYNSLLKSARNEIHDLVASTLEKQFPEIVETRPELVASHYSAAGKATQAFPYFLRAGRRCSDRSENLEAVVHIRKGLELVPSLGEGPQRLGAELELLVVLSNPLVRTRGYGAPEVESTMVRARELCRALGDTPQLLAVLAGLAIFHTARADLRSARELGEEVLRLTKNTDNPTLELMAHRALASALFWQGDLELSRQSLVRAIAIYRRETHGKLAYQYFVDPGVVCFSTLGLALWMLGYPDQALSTSKQALQLGRATSHPFSMGFALVYAAAVHQLRREVEPTLQLANEAIALSAEQAFPQGLAWGAALRGWVFGQQGNAEAGLAELRSGIARWQGTGTQLVVPYFLCLLADTHRVNGEAREGLAVIGEAMAMIDRTGERCWESELCRMRGELTLISASNEAATAKRRALLLDAEEGFRTALTCARAHGSKGLELRAAVSLARMQTEGSKGRPDAIALLEEVCNQFPERTPAPDLRDATAILDAERRLARAGPGV